MSWLLGHTESDEDAEIPGGSDLEKEEPEKDKEVQQEATGFTSFWGALNTLKTKSLSAIETTKKDFTDFGSAFSSETKEIREEVSEAFKPKPASEEKVVEGAVPEATNNQTTGPSVLLARAEEKLTDNLEKLSQGVESLAEKVWGGAVTLLPSIFGMSGLEDITEGADKAGKLTKEQELKTLQGNSLTYTSAIEPENSAAFEELTQDFSEHYDAFWGTEVTKMLANSLIRAHYDQLVPEVMSEDAFWCHYVFRKRALDSKYERKQQLESRLAQTKDDNSFGDLGWDEDETPSGKLEAKVAIDVNPKEVPPTPPPTPITPTHAVVTAKIAAKEKEKAVEQEQHHEAEGEEGEEGEEEEAAEEAAIAAASEKTEVSDAVVSSKDVANNRNSPSLAPSSSSSQTSSSTTTTTSTPVNISATISTTTNTAATNSTSASSSSTVMVASPAPSEPVVMHMHREISGSPESSDWESTKLVPSQSDSEPWDAGVEDAVLKAMCETPDIALDASMEGLILVPQGEEADSTNATTKQTDDWDQWE